MLNRPAMLALAALIGLAAPTLAAADDELDLSVVADDEDEFDFLKGNDAPKEADLNTDFDLLDAEEDEFANFKLAPAEPAPAPTQARAEPAAAKRSSKLPFDVTGKVALQDNFPAQVVHVDNDAVVVELPVLVAADASQAASESFWLVAELYSGGQKVAESRQLVSQASVAQTGPTIAFFKMLAPVADPSGTLEIRVGQVSAGGGAPKALFTKPVNYKLGS